MKLKINQITNCYWTTNCDIKDIYKFIKKSYKNYIIVNKEERIHAVKKDSPIYYKRLYWNTCEKYNDCYIKFNIVNGVVKEEIVKEEN
jgi:hypothetical protein